MARTKRFGPTPAGRRRPKPAPPGDVAVVIPCHNYGRYLAEAIDSALRQSHPPAEVLVVDDASGDETPQVAAGWSDRGVRYVRVEARNPHAARRAGFHATTAPWLCFLDADDRLPADYLARGLAAAGPDTGIVNSDLQEFGETRRRRPLRFARRTFWRWNTVHAGVLVRRAALELSGAFERDLPVDCVEDWALWRPVVADGWPLAHNPAAYERRTHAGSRGAVRDRHGFYEQAFLAGETVTLFVALSGRRALWPRLRAFLERQTWPRHQTRLMLLDTSGDAGFGRLVREWAAGCDYPDVRYRAERVGPPGLADADRRDRDVLRRVQRAAARIYTRAVRETAGEYLWILEDDVEPPADVCERLLRRMGADVASVAAPYRSPYHAGYIAWDRRNRTLHGGTGVEEVGGNGFGCVLLRRSVAAEVAMTHAGRNGNFDQEFYRRLPGLERGRLRALLDWSCTAAHHRCARAPRFVILTTGRSGSTLLVEALDAHPQVRCYGEPLNPVYGYDRTAETDGREVMERMLPAERDRATGCKLGVCQPRPGYEAWATAWDWLRERPDVRILWLTRRDRLAWYASGKIARLTTRWRIDDPDDPYLDPDRRPTVRIDPAEFRLIAGRIDARLETLHAQLADHPQLAVTYEELVGDWPATTARVQRFLSVAPRELPQQTLRGETRPLQEVVANWQELVDAGLAAA